MKRALAFAMAASLVAPTPAAAQVLRGNLSAGSAVPTINISVPSVAQPVLAPSFQNSLPLTPQSNVVFPSLLTPSIAVQAVPLKAAVAVKPFAVKAAVAVKPNLFTPAAVKVMPLLPSVPEALTMSARFDGARALAAASVEPVSGKESAVSPALKPAAVRPELTIAAAAREVQSKSRKAGARALAWWRLSGIVAPVAALVAAIPAYFGMEPTAWLALSGVWVAGPAAWHAIPSAWRREHPAAAASAAFAAGAVVGWAVALVAGWSLLTAVGATAALGLAFAASTGAFAAVRSRAGPATGLLGVDGKGDERRLWIPTERFGRLLLLTAGFERGFGEKDLHSAKTDAYERAVYFRRTGEFVELVARDLSRRAEPGSPLTRALADVNADATIGKAKIVAEDPVTGAVAVDLKDLAVQDMFSIKGELEDAFGAYYALDKDLSALTRADAYERNVEIGARLVYALDKNSEPSDAQTRLPDARRLGLSVRLSFADLPEAGYRPRKADSRVGHFATLYEDWTDDRAERPTRALVNRWRLEKADPSAAASKVKTPVVFWLDPSVPATYRDAVRRGVLAWNAAFEKIGLLGAVEVRDAPEGFDASDARHTVIRWFVDKDANYAIGQTRADPVTGEIYQATLGIAASHPRAALGSVFTDIGEGGDEKPAGKKSAAHRHGPQCNHAESAAKQARMSLAVLESRGGLSEAEKEKFVQDYVTDLTMHEVGHTLGLRHNFLAKTWKTAAELSGDAPLAASVMDYLPTNVAPPGAKQGSFWNTELGPYDFWAIEYAYKPLSPETEAAELAAIAARAGEPGLAYATDEDLVGVDPNSQTWYLGRDPLEWARGRIATVRELWKSLETSAASGAHTASYRAFVQGWRGYLDAARLAVMIVGGLNYRRDAGKNAPFTPVAGASRRAALALIEETVFSDAPFDASADLRRRLDPGREPTVDDPMPRLGWLPYDELTLWLRQDALGRLLDPDLMELLSEGAKMAPAGDEAVTPRELIETLTKMIWREVVEPIRKRKASISPSRRRLQEAHLNLLILLAYRSAEDEVPEVSALARAHLTRLSETLADKAERKAWDDATRDHLRQSANKIDSADSRYEP